jgi:HEAT repeat protein
MIKKPCLALLVCVAILSIGCTKKKKEVTYEGKPLSEWINMLRDEDPTKRFAAIGAVRQIGPEAKEAIPILIETIREVRNNRDRRMLVACNKALLGMGKEIVPHMISLLKDETWEMRRGSAWMLGKLGPDARDAVPALTEALNDPQPAVRAKAAEALKKIKGEEGDFKKPVPAESAPEEK